MFVMLSVHTTTTVRERQTDTVKNKVNNQLYTSSIPSTTATRKYNTIIKNKNSNNTKNKNNIFTRQAAINHWKNDQHNNNNNSNNKKINNKNTLIVTGKSKSIDQIFESITSQSPSIVFLPTSIEKGASILTPTKLNKAPTSPPIFLQSELNNFKKPSTVQVKK